MKFYELFGFPVTCSTGQVNRIQRSSFKNRFNLRFDKSFGGLVSDKLAFCFTKLLNE